MAPNDALLPPLVPSSTSYSPNTGRLIDMFGRDSPRPANNQVIAVFIYNGRNFNVLVGKYSGGVDGREAFNLSGPDPSDNIFSAPKLLKLYEGQADDPRHILYYDSSRDPLGRQLNVEELALMELHGYGSFDLSSISRERRTNNRYFWAPFVSLRQVYEIARETHGTEIGGRKRRKSKRRQSKRRRSIKY